MVTDRCNCCTLNKGAANNKNEPKYKCCIHNVDCKLENVQTSKRKHKQQMQECCKEKKKDVKIDAAKKKNAL